MTNDFYRGAFEAFTYVLNYLNTLDEKQVDKKKLYKDIMGFRPKDIIND